MTAGCGLSLSGVYLIHGLNLQVVSADAGLRDDLDERLAYFRTTACRPPNATFSFEMVQSLRRARQPKDGRLLYEALASQVRYVPERDELDVRAPGLKMRLRPSMGRAAVSLLSDDAEAAWHATHSVFALALMETLKRRGIFSLHAAAATLNGRAVLLAGPNGSGKSTLALAVLRSGVHFQGDDLVFLRRGPAGVRILPFPDRIGVTTETAALIPELAHEPRLRASPPPGARKHEIDIGVLWPAATIESETAPAAIVLLAGDGQSGRYRLGSVSAPEALAALAVNVLPTEATTSQAHLEALAELVESCPCFRLSGRGELHEAVDLIRVLL